MPLHVIHTAKGVLAPEDKEAIAAAITKVYSQLPPFYVVVTFYESDFFFIGGKHNNKFVRIVTQHLARDYSTPDATDKVSRISSCYHWLLLPS
jgi:phenylpyruvate tautomerase PptA (4-oxalocrotonate tautomerase family)